MAKKHAAMFGIHARNSSQVFCMRIPPKQYRVFKGTRILPTTDNVREYNCYFDAWWSDWRQLVWKQLAEEGNIFPYTHRAPWNKALTKIDLLPELVVTFDQTSWVYYIFSFTYKHGLLLDGSALECLFFVWMCNSIRFIQFASDW